MQQMNEFFFSGVLANDPEEKTYGTFKKVECLVSQTSRYKDKEGNEKEQVVTLPFSTWGQAAVGLLTLKKDQPVFISGRLRSGQSDKTGTTRYFPEIVASSVIPVLGGATQTENGALDENSIPF